DEIARWRLVDEALVAPLESLRALVEAGGKRLRPAFCHWAFVGAGGDRDDPRVVDAGAAFEMLHAFALIHDDLLHASDTGPPSPPAPRGARGRPAPPPRPPGRPPPPPPRPGARGGGGGVPPVRRGGRHPHRRPGPRLRRPPARRRAGRRGRRVARAAARAQ